MDIDSRSTMHNLSSEMPTLESGRLYSLEEWDAMFPVPERKPSPVQNGSGPTIKPLPVVQITGEHVANLNNLCQLHAIAPHFTIPEIAKGCFSAKVEFGSDVCEEAGPFPSKRQAKDAVAVKALEILSSREIPKKRKASGSDSPDSKRKMLDNGENWVGRLQDFCQQKKCALPIYTDYEANLRQQQLAGLTTNCKQFAYTVKVQAAPGQVFGSELTLFGTKNEAKKNAAKEAVLWLRTNGVMKAESSPKHIKVSTPDQQIKLTQSMAKINTDQSISQLVHDRSIQLGLTQPRYEIKPGRAPVGAVVPNFYTASAWYLEQDAQKEPSLQGPLCQTEVVYGQKKAKELCSKELLGVLDRLLAQKAGGHVSA